MSHRSRKNEALLAKFLYEAVDSTDIRRIYIILREERANPNFILEEYGISPFHFVIGNESKKFAYEATKLMLHFGADPNIRSEDGLTPVHIAAAWNRTAILHQLLKSGGDPFLRDDENKSAADYALEGGLTKALQIINYHAMRYTPSKKVYLYRDDVRAEYTARPAIQDQKRSNQQEEVFRYPDISSSSTSSSEISITHPITIPPSGNVRIESSVHPDNEMALEHQYELADNNIKRTVQTYLKDCQVYECIVPGDSSSARSCLKENRTPEKCIKSQASTPNRKTPSSVNFSSLCNNLAKEMHEKLRPPEMPRSGLNVTNDNPDLYQTCLAEPQEVEMVSSCCKSTVMEPCSSLERKKCVRNIFIDECNTSSPSHLNSENIPCSVIQKSVCKNCEDIFCNNFKIICYHFCDLHRPISNGNSCFASPCNNCAVPPASLSDNKTGCENKQKNLIGFEKIERNERAERASLKSALSLNRIESLSALPIGFIIGDHQNKNADLCDSPVKTKLENGVGRPSSTPNNKRLKTKPNSNFVKNRAKLEKAFLNCLRKNEISNKLDEKQNAYSQTSKSSAVIYKNCNSVSGSNEPESHQSGWKKKIKDTSKEVNLSASADEHSDTANSSFRSSVVNDSYQSLRVEVVNESSGDYKMSDPSSPKKCNICDYQDQSNEMDTSQMESNPFPLTCSSNSCSEAKKNRVSLPVASSPVKLSENCVELHFPFFPVTGTDLLLADESSEKQTSLPLDTLNNSSCTLTVVKVSSNGSSSDDKVVSDVQPSPVLTSGSVESLTNISDMAASRQSNSSENPRKTSVDGINESDVTNCFDVAFCLSDNHETADTATKTVTGSQSDGRDSCATSQHKSEISSNHSELSDAFFSSSERCSPLHKNRFSLNEKHRDTGCDLCPESSSDYFSPNELTRSYFTSDDEPSFLAPVACKGVKNTQFISSKKWTTGLHSVDKDEFGFDGIIITSDDEPASKSEPEFNVCEEFKYVDSEKDIVFRETRFKSSTVRLSALNGFEDLSLTKNKRKTHELSDGDFSETVSSVSSHSYDTDALRSELKQKGYVPGPITFTTKRLYLRKLKKINKRKLETNASDSGVSIQNPDSFSQEADRTINQTNDKEWQNLLQSWSYLETKMSSYFETPTRHAKWRGGISKSSFTYLLLDPRVTDSLPVRSQTMSSMAVWSTFLKAIFYVGKGKRSRPYSHLYEAVKLWNAGNSSTNHKLQYILNLWKSNHGVVCLNVFQNIMPVEALTREAAMIEALGLKNLKNERHGEYYGPCSSWSMKLKCQLGCFLLYRAMIVFLADGERQLQPYDVD